MENHFLAILGANNRTNIFLLLLLITNVLTLFSIIYLSNSLSKRFIPLNNFKINTQLGYCF